jgi:hypothetical protein
MFFYALATGICLGITLWFLLADREPNELFLSVHPHYLCPEICEALMLHVCARPNGYIPDDTTIKPS